MNNETYQGWIANLSNGKNAFEGPPIPGQKTPWQTFIDYLHTNPTYIKDVWDEETGNYIKKEMPVHITRMQLRTAGVTVNSLPYKECDGYMYAQEIRKLVYRGTEKHLRGIGSVVGNNVHITWVDEYGEILQDVRSLDECLLHTTLREPDATTSNQPRPGREA